jgi:hypothetical protein
LSIILVYLGFLLCVNGAVLILLFIFYQVKYMFEKDLSIQQFEVKFDSSAADRRRTLYANGRMQIRVLVRVSAADAQGNEVSLHGHPALQTLKLISYNDGTPLEGNWISSRQENRYAHDMSGREASITPLIPASDNRISDPSETIQVFEFWVSSKRVGSLQIAAELMLDGKRYRSNGQNGYDSSVSLDAVAPKRYPAGSFLFGGIRSVEQKSSYDRLEQFGLSLFSEGRVIHLLDWSSDQVKYDPDYAGEFFYSGNLDDGVNNLRTYFGFIAPVYGESVTVKTHYGSRTLPQEAGRISIFVYATAEPANKPARTETFELKVFDEFGTDHRLRINSNTALRSFFIS